MTDTLWLMAMLIGGVALLVAATRLGPGPSPGRGRRGRRRHAGRPLGDGDRFTVETLDLAAGQWRLATMRRDGEQLLCLRVAGPRSPSAPARAPATSYALLSRGSTVAVLGRHQSADGSRSCYRVTGDLVLAARPDSPADRLLASMAPATGH